MSDRTWPLSKYDYAEATWEEHISDREAFIIDKRYENIYELDPGSVPRVTADYTVATDNDPHGPRGTVVKAETQEEYAANIAADKKEMKRCWAKAIPGYKGQIRRVANAAHAEKPFDPRWMFKKVDEEFGTKTDKTNSRFVKKFISRTKMSTEKITDFNREWNDSIERLRATDMDLPPKFLVNLYLISLGFQYRAVEATANVLPDHERTLAKVMSLAVDHSVDEDADEVDNSDKALVAILKERGFVPRTDKRNYEAAFAATESRFENDRPPLRCGNCRGLWHTKEECFNKGGGLAHLDSQGRRSFLDRKRKEREDRREDRKYNNRSYRREDEARPKEKEGAKRVKELEDKVKEQEEKMERADRIVGDLGFDIDLQMK